MTVLQHRLCWPAGQTAAPHARQAAPRPPASAATAVAASRPAQRRRRRPACAAAASGGPRSSAAAPARDLSAAAAGPQAALLRAMMDAHLADLETATAAGGGCSASETRLDAIYDALDEEVFFSKGGFVIPEREKQRIDATGGSASYGEVQPRGIDQLIRYLALDADSVFVDLGCGRGRAVLQAAMHSPVARAVGLDLSESRLEQAEAALEALRRQGATMRPVEFRLADLSSCSLEEGTHFYLCSTAFGAGICRSLAERLAASPNFCALATSRQLPSQPFLYKLAEVPAEYSFNASGHLYLYVRSPAAAPPAVLARSWCSGGACWLPDMSLRQLGMSVDEPVAAAAARQFVSLGGP